MGNKSSKSKKSDSKKPATETPTEQPPTQDEVEKIFKKYDTDNSGHLEIDEIQTALKDLAADYKVNPSEAEVLDLISGIDVNGDNKLKLSEFRDLYNQIKGAGQAIYDQFKFFDKNGDGKVQKAELRKAMEELNESLSKTELKRMIKEADMDGDGEIDFEEFQKILCCD